jgi:rare lipoprotein A
VPLVLTAVLVALAAAGCAGSGGGLSGEPGEAFEGVASYYAHRFHGRTTASGEVYDENALTAAHRDLPFGTRVRVTNLANGRQVLLRINDRGPFVAGRVIDVSFRAARDLDFIAAGLTRVRIQIVGDGGGL